jgi:hypothetical protein
MLEEWLKLRQRGVSTPTIAVWTGVRLSAKDNIWRVYLDRVYSQDKYNELFLRDPRSGKRVIFVIDSQNASDVNHAAVAALEDAGFVVQVCPWVMPHSPTDSPTHRTTPALCPW